MPKDAITPLKIIDVCEWEGVEVPPRQWLLPDWIPWRATTGIYGAGGIGKSLLLQQLASCSATRMRFLGHEVRHVKAMHVACEDDRDELHRRQTAINAVLGVSYADFPVNGLQLIERAGEQSSLC